MKRFVLICSLFFAFAAHADNVTQAQPIPLKQAPPNVTIINGKRFYSLQNVRRFNGSVNSPRALSVINHPHGQGIANMRRTGPVYTPAPASSSPDTKPIPGGAKPDSDQVLSIFAPEDKHAGLPAPIK